MKYAGDKSLELYGSKRGIKTPRFFHCLTSSHWNTNTIGKLLINGSPSTSQDEIRDHIVQFSEHLYREDGYRRPYLEGIQFDAIFDEDALWLERPFEETKIESVVQGCNGDKASGPDGFSLAFFQNCWSIVHSDIPGVCQEFHEHC